MCYYLCCFGCCGLCCQKQFVRKPRQKSKLKTTKLLEKVSSLSRRKTLSERKLNPLSVKTTEISDFYVIPNEKFKTPEEFIESKGFKLTTHLGTRNLR